MGTPAQHAPEYYVWTVEGKNVEIHMDLDVIDAILSEMMRGYGALPKRGAEVGGLLLGSIERGATTIVRIDDFEPVQCGYTRGPSYLFSADEKKTFEDACARWRSETPRSTSSTQSYAVGIYRSHTREGLALAPEDVELMDGLFPGPSHVVLLVKPFATKASPAGFFFREQGVFQKTTPLEFPFRRHDLTGEEAPEHRPFTERGSRERGTRALVRTGPEQGAAEAADGEALAGAPSAEYAGAMPSRSRLGSWMWFPMSFIFLLLGVALGYLAALNVGPRGAGGDYSLLLAVQRSGDALLLRWNNESPLIRQADRGVLEIHDGTFATSRDLDATSLRNGKLTFQNSTSSVTFRLTVYLSANLSVTQTLAWPQ